MKTNNQPATPLPYSLDRLRPEPTHMYATIRASDRTIPIRVSGPNASQDATYLVIASNAYPRLVEALRQITFGREDLHHEAHALLRELGEAS